MKRKGYLDDVSENCLDNNALINKVSNEDENGFNIYFKICICLLSGIVFGIAMHKGQITDPGVIKDQLVFKQFTLFKFFFSGLATSMFVMSLLSMFPQTRKSFILSSNEYFKKISGFSFYSCVIGGILMGSGMALAGSCPVMVFSQIGAFVPNSVYTFSGSMTAALIYCLFESAIDSILNPDKTVKYDNIWNNSPFFIHSLPLVTMFAILVGAFETLFPSGSAMSNQFWLFSYPWPSYISGIAIGMLQIPLILYLNKTLSGSSSQLVLISQIFRGPFRNLSSFACKYHMGFQSWWQVFYVFGIIIGGFTSAYHSNSLKYGSRISSPVIAFLGGFLMNIGGRIGGGCTSNHGLTGMGLLSIFSFIMIASTFISAILLSFILQFMSLDF